MISLLLLTAHLIGDFILQTDRMAEDKFDNHWVRLVHVLLYLVPFCFLFLMYDLNTVAIFLGSLGVLHFMTDLKRWKVPRNSVDSMWIDQITHIAHIAILGYLLL